MASISTQESWEQVAVKAEAIASHQHHSHPFSRKRRHAGQSRHPEAKRRGNRLSTDSHSTMPPNDLIGKKRPCRGAWHGR
jgi:hypothetical protein